MRSLDFNGGPLWLSSLWALALMAPRGRSAARPAAAEEEVEDTGGGGDGEPMGIIELEDNLDDVEKPPEVPAGMYLAEIQDVQKKTSGKGNEYFSIKFVIPQEELPATIREGFEDGATFYWNRQLVPKGKDRRALYNLKLFMGAIGLDTNVTSIDPSEWMGAQARLRVVMGTYQGTARAEVRSVEPAEAAPRQAAKPRGRK